MLKIYNNKKSLYPLLFVIAFLLADTVAAQVWVPVTHASGSRVINGRTVTVTSAGSVRTEGTFAHCGANPYTVGINYNGIPGSYTYSFSPATTTVRFLMSATNLGEVNSFYINGTQYMITAANIQPLPTCDPQLSLPISAQNGNAVFLGPVVPGYPRGHMGSGIVEITYPTGINSIRVESNGVMGGTTYGFAYWGFYAEAFNDSACHGNTLHLFGGPTEPGVTYRWTGPNGFVSTDQNATILNANPTHDGQYVLRTVFNVDTAYDTTIVRTRPIPATPVVTADTVVCVGGSAFFQATSSTAGVQYTWDGPNGYRSTTANANIRNARDRDTGVYTVIASLNGCSSPPAPVPLKVMHPVSGDTIPVQICPGGAYDFFGNTVNAEGIYAHTLSGTSSYGCDSVTYISVSFTEPPRDTISASICQGSSYEFNGIAVSEPGLYSDTLQTSAGCDSVVVLQLVVNPAARDTVAVRICAGDGYVFGGRQLTETGTYTDTVKTTAGCDSAVVLQLTVHELPVITASYDSDRTPCLGDTVRLQGTGGVAYIWRSNGTQIGAHGEISYVLMHPDNAISLQATDANECTDSAHLEIAAVACCNTFVPNAFTPNNDGRNDQFRIFSESRINQYQMDIMNRWGRLVFTTTDINTGWDGTINGQPADVGTYFYQIKGKCLSGTEIYEKGDITLIR